MSSRTRWLVDESSFGNAGNTISTKCSDRRRGADPPNNESGRTSFGSPNRRISKVSRAGNGFCIAATNRSDSGVSERHKEISHTRPLSSRAATMLSDSASSHVTQQLSDTTMGKKVGQISSISLTGRLSVQSSRNFRRCGDAKTVIAIFGKRVSAFANHVRH